MSGFRMVIEMRREQWDAMSPEEQQDLQTLVDETFDPVPKHRSDAQFDRDQAAAEGWGLQEFKQHSSGGTKV